MNRTYDLRKTLSFVVESANASPQTEIVILNYSSTDDMDDYMEWVRANIKPAEFNRISYFKLDGMKYYNSAHARNLCVKYSGGDYFIMLATDILPKPNMVKYVRDLIESKHPTWACEGWMGRLLVCRKLNFMESGGYDERFRLYAPEDKDICQRLHRCGLSFELLPKDLVDEIYTPNEEKLRNLDLSDFGNKREMARVMAPIYHKNNEDNIMTANPNGWGEGGVRFIWQI